MKKVTVIASSAALVGVAVVLGGCDVEQAASTLPGAPAVGSSTAALGDVAISECKVSKQFGIGQTAAKVKITNTTDRTQSYLITISMNDASGARISELNAASNSLTAGQVATADAMGIAPESAEAGPMQCVVANVDRIPS